VQNHGIDGKVLNWISNWLSGRVQTVVKGVVDASTVNAFKARLDKFWSHQAVKFDFTAVLTGTGNRSEVLKKL